MFIATAVKPIYNDCFLHYTDFMYYTYYINSNFVVCWIYFMHKQPLDIVNAESINGFYLITYYAL